MNTKCLCWNVFSVVPYCWEEKGWRALVMLFNSDGLSSAGSLCILRATLCWIKCWRTTRDVWLTMPLPHTNVPLANNGFPTISFSFVECNWVFIFIIKTRINTRHNGTESGSGFVSQHGAGSGSSSWDIREVSNSHGISPKYYAEIQIKKDSRSKPLFRRDNWLICAIFSTSLFWTSVSHKASKLK